MNTFDKFHVRTMAVLFVSLGGSALSEAQYSFALLDVPGYGKDVAYGAGPGEQVGYAENSLPDDDRAILWTGTSASAVSLDPGGVYLESRALATNGIHQVGWARQGAGGGGNQHAAVWTGAASTFVDLNPLGYYRSQAHGVDGDVQAGWAANLVDSHDNAMIWRGSHDLFTNLHPTHLPAYTDSYCLAAADGIQAGYAHTIATHAALWAGSSGTFTDLHPTGAAYSQAFATGGSTQGGYAVFGSTYHAGIWSGSAASFTDLHPAGSTTSTIYGVRGSKQVGMSSGHATLWSGSAASAFDLHAYVTGGYTGSTAYAISSDGTIVGAVSFGAATSVAAMWTPVPEPSTLLVCLMGTLVICVGMKKMSP